MSGFPSAVLLDLDDTLISFDGVSAGAWEESYALFLRQHSCPFPKEALSDAVRTAQKWYWGDPARHKAGRENLRAARREVVALALRALGMDDPDAVRSLADDYTRRHEASLCVYPNTHPTLTELRRRGVRLALITNGSGEGQRAKLARFNLAGYFEHILIDQELGFGKPDVRVFEHALSLLNLRGRDAWMVGDNLVWDIRPPQSLGIRAIWHDWRKSGLAPDSAIVPDGIIQDIGELLRPGA